MNLIRLSLCSLRFRALSNGVNVVVLALGIATIVTLLRLDTQVEGRFHRDLAGIDLVVGAKGSPIQLILSSVFHLDIPNGNIPLAEAEKLEKNPLIKEAIPISLGDSYHGFRIVGTTPAYARHYKAEFAQGTDWSKPLEAVLGSDVARASGIHVGDSFVGTHGINGGGEEHEAFPYRVVGILKPSGSVVDRLVLTNLESVWKIHALPDEDEPEEMAMAAEHGGKMPREVTSLLISYRSPFAAVKLPRLIDKSSSMQAASPAFETARLLKIVGFGTDAVRLFAVVLMAIAATGFFVALFNAVNERAYDIALMRSLGATRRKVVGFVLVEGLLLGLMGALLGLALGHGLSFGVEAWIEQTRHMTLPHVGLQPYEGLVVLIALGISAVAAVAPSVIAYRVDVPQVLSEGS